MSSAKNHTRRSHRSHKAHFAAVHSMRQFMPKGGMGLTFGLFGGRGKHRKGRARDSKRVAAQ